MYDLTAKARPAVVGRNAQLDEDAGRKIWKCLNPLNCVALAAYCVALHIGQLVLILCNAAYCEVLAAF